MHDAQQHRFRDEIENLPEQLREASTRWLEQLIEQDKFRDGLDTRSGDLVRLIACSEYAGAMMLREWEWFVQRIVNGKLDVSPSYLDAGATIDELRADNPDSESLRRRLRIFRHRQFLHILWRAICNRDNEDFVDETLDSLSGLADVLIAAATRAATETLRERFGVAKAEDGMEIPLLTLGMGKLGGRELNFSSDIDLIFLYPQEGETDGARTISAHEYFTRVARLVTSILDEITEDGFVFRVDTRLRPFGDSGPVVVSFAALETYLVQHGRSWERYAYVKARVINDSATKEQVADLMQNMIEPFVYRRYLDYGVFESLRDMKALVAAEVERRDLAGNVKLGPGGIREIEFIVQSLQLVRGGSDKHLRGRELLAVLPKLGQGKGLNSSAIRSLSRAYRFLRRLENAIQAIRDQQEHDIPDNTVDRARLALALNYDAWQDLAADLEIHRQSVSAIFAEIAFRTEDQSTHSNLTELMTRNWKSGANEGLWATVLQDNGFAESTELAQTIVRFAGAPIYEKIDAVARRRLAYFIPALLVLARERQHPDVICRRVLDIVSNIMRRSAYIALLNENPAAMRYLVMLVEKSAFLATEIARFPMLLDELLDPRLSATDITCAAMRTDLAERLRDIDPTDVEQQVEILGQFQRATLFRVAVADFSGNLPVMKVSDRLTELAEVVVGAALAFAWSDLTRKHGLPRCGTAGEQHTAGLAVIAYGKMGGMELSYQSDLDLVFLHDAKLEGGETDGETPLDNNMFFARLTRRLVHFLSAQTGSGALYDVDTRLRPSGRSGLLVINVDGFRKYQEQDAWTWEHQALLRSRPIAGSQEIAREFEDIRTQTLCGRINQNELASDVLSMRKRMRKELDKSVATGFDLKQGEGGIGDIEFLVQFLVLKNAATHPALIHYTDNIRQLGALDATGILDPDAVARLQAAYRDFRRTLHHLSLDDQPSLVDPSTFEEERAFVSALWQREIVSATNACKD